MQERSWIKENQPQRHITIKLATHGFHHKLCKTKIYHELCESCLCELCGDQCDRYHILKCLNRVFHCSDKNSVIESCQPLSVGMFLKQEVMTSFTGQEKCCMHLVPFVINECKKCPLDQKLCVENYKFGAGGNQVVALVELEELNEYLAFILLCKENKI
ncbi:hypothetical protein C0J52_18284 [Blattella germanica]|nr:hypothetical protein C0J52_18284 [Blattella germanica]